MEKTNTKKHRDGKPKKPLKISDLDHMAKEGQPGFNPLYEAAAQNKYSEEVRQKTQKYQTQKAAKQTVPEEEKGGPTGTLEVTNCSPIDGKLCSFIPSPEGYDSLVSQLVEYMYVFKTPNALTVPTAEGMRALIRVAIFQQFAKTMPGFVANSELLNLNVYLPEKIQQVIKLLGKIKTTHGEAAPHYDDEWIKILSHAAGSTDEKAYSQVAHGTVISFHTATRFIKQLHGFTYAVQVPYEWPFPQGKKVLNFLGTQPVFKEPNVIAILTPRQINSIIVQVRSAFESTLFTPSMSGSICQLVTMEGYSLTPISDVNASAGIQLGVTFGVFQGEGFIATSNVSSETRWDEMFKSDLN